MAGKALSGFGERALVARLRRLHDPDGSGGIGDDCAVLRIGSETVVATTDITFDGVHYPRDAPPNLKGWYAAAVNLSDLAAMGARPLGLLVAYGFPSDTPIEAFGGISGGVERCANAHGTKVLGGDTKTSGLLTICVTALGEAPPGGALMRSGAGEGDALVLTGRIGRAHEWMLKGGNSGLGRMLRVEARLAEGAALASAGATSCTDLSDGLALSLHYLSEASGVGMEVRMDDVPFYPGVRSDARLEAASYGGDFELLATVPRGKLAVAHAKVRKAGGQLTEIGCVCGTGVRFSQGGRTKFLPKSGFEHFRRPKK
ncbi:MAG: thiamine-phosphate kinase [Methanobacteriota archaeon]